ncbi:hypothetical protein NKR19_g9026 [Coniochaeta hoffmannii]|uniref:PPPDE domain-containing protein n=1 Tax=Coniochaeta hoffmannii TaxID=91930 RepID=A0AA38R2G5_9PEZI|nr:hypothetical protein NKR19_g9026 [Coniochaeta hoffmannii]
MVFHILPMLAIAAGQAYIRNRKRENEASDTARRLAEAERERKKALLRAISAKLTGPGVSEMAPLEYDYSSDTKAVLLVMNPIQLGTVQLSRSIHSMLGKHVGMSLDSVSHWALIVVDRSLCETNYCYELMSDEKTLSMLGKNVARSNELTAAMTESWKCCYYVGETTRSHSDIQNLATEYTRANPRYNVFTNNCQNMVEKLVKDICNNKVISRQKLSEELVVASPRIGLYLMVAKVAANVFVGDTSLNDSSVARDLNIIKGLWKADTYMDKHRITY